MTDGPEATNHIHTLASVLIHLAALDGDPEQAEQINRIIDIFEAGVVTAEDGTVYWKYFPFFADQSIGPNGREYSERIWKASQTVPFIYRAYAAGYDVPEPLIEAIVRTFLTHVVRGDRVLRNLSPVESREVDADEEGGHLDGLVTWLELAAFEPEIADRIRHIFAARPDLFPGGWFGSTNSARGYAHFLSKD